ncbi:integrase domain-containing protein [Pseudomonas sp. 18175]|uniref:integrase domain-containing protein n=1 Tax=Pseudomonas sp. 18175 TaxID=3390056 RepID=UPI003D1DFA2F
MTHPLRPAPAPTRRSAWAGLTPQQVLDRYPPGRCDPLRVLEVLIELFNTQHTAREKTVSHKTRHERAAFLRRFYVDLRAKAGFNTLPDPRRLRQKHLRAMAGVWSAEGLAAATIQTYLSFLRGLACWVGKPGLVRAPAFYGLTPTEYRRHENALYDHSWSAQGVVAETVIEQVQAFDRYVGAALRLILAFGLRRKESVLCRPFAHAQEHPVQGLCLRVTGKGGRVRWLPVDSPARRDALTEAQQVVSHTDAPLGDPTRDLRANLRRFDYVMAKFGLTHAVRGVTAHGLRHQVLIERYETLTGVAPPVRGSPDAIPRDQDLAARRTVAELAGHARPRASGAYLGGTGRGRRRKTPT